MLPDPAGATAGTAVAEVLPGISAIDTMMGGRAVVTSAYLIEAAEPALVETGPTTSLEPVIEGLRSKGIGPGELAHVVVTHIHLDHAGGAGGVSERFPNATVWVHERGASHLSNPDRLVASAERVYGRPRLQALFGPVVPVPTERLRAVSDGDVVVLGNRQLEVVYTPGHASHHVSLIDSETGALFTGDALGIHLPDVGVLRPATPPPDIDVELSLDSIGRIRSRARSILLFSHYGPVEEVDELCEIAATRLRRWAGTVREALDQTDELDRVAEILAAREMRDLSMQDEAPVDLSRYDLLADMRINAAGLVRYWRKQEAGKESAAERAEGS